MPNGLVIEWQGTSRSMVDPVAQLYGRKMEELEGLTLPAGALRRPMKEIIIEGCFGDAAIGRYWGAVADHAKFGRIKLWG